MKLCPFCGAKATVDRQTTSEAEGYRSTVRVVCVCGASTTAISHLDENGRSKEPIRETEDRALKAWNRRTG